MEEGERVREREMEREGRREGSREREGAGGRRQRWRGRGDKVND